MTSGQDIKHKTVKKKKERMVKIEYKVEQESTNYGSLKLLPNKCNKKQLLAPSFDFERTESWSRS